jgi:cellulose synthase/poly-beta-1,6-N-acetylglucosamine synthase-like glycosyltransferase
MNLIIKFFRIINLFFFCLLIFRTYIKINPKDFNIKKKLERYIKFKKKNNLPTKNFELELPMIKKYIKELRENYNDDQKYYSKINNPKISFIASVYNKEKYLSAFISSIQNQLLNEFEIIIVDDGSTDNSVRIIN